MNTHRQADDEIPGIGGLRFDRAPPRDLWPGIEQRIARPRRRLAAPVWLAMAASVLVVIGLFGWQAPSPTPEAPTATASPVALAVADGRLPVTERALIKANLQIADHAERDLLAAIDRQPDSPDLQRLLRSTRQRQQHLQALL